MNIALIAHDKRKELMVQFCVENCGILAKHKLCATASTGKLVTDATGLEIQRFMGGVDGGDQQIGARIANGEVDLLFYLRDGTESGDPNHDGNTLLRLCDVHNIPYATNLVMAEVVVRALERGDFDWAEQYMPIIRKKRTGYSGLY